MHIYIYITYVYTYIYAERERDSIIVMIYDYSRKTNIILITIEYIYNLTYNIITINNAVPSKYIHVYIYIYVRRDRDIPGKISDPGTFQADCTKQPQKASAGVRLPPGTLLEVLHDRILEIRWMVASEIPITS